MNATQRRTVTAGILGLAMAAAPALAQQQRPAQRGGPPGSDTPSILITAFLTNNRPLAVEAADELRKRVQSEHSARELYALPKTQIEAALNSYGYPVDSALGSSDLMEFSRNLRGDYAIDGKATKSGSGNGVRLETRILLRTGTTTLAQPLPVADGKDVGEAAKIVERSIAEALKGMPNYKECISDLRGQNYEKAEKDARLGLEAYKNSVLSRVCLLQAQTALKAPPDSIIANANAILATDSTSLLALANKVDAYKAKGDTANAVATDVAIAHLDLANPSVVLPIVDDLYKLGGFDRAVGLLEPLLKENPSDATLLKKKWALLMTVASRGAPGAYKRAIAAGEAMVKADTVEATLDYFKRQIGAAQADSDATKASDLAAQAGEKFPKEITFQLLMAQTYMKQGKAPQGLDAARHALEIDSKNVTASQYVLFALHQLGQTDSIVGAAQKMIAGGIPKDSLAQSLLAVVRPALEKAQASKERADWENALKAADTVDAIAPSAQSAFYIGRVSYQIAADLITHLQTLTSSTKAADRALACTEAKQSEELLAKTSIAMPRGASVDKTAAAQILTNVGSLGDYVGEVKKRSCK